MVWGRINSDAYRGTGASGAALNVHGKVPPRLCESTVACYRPDCVKKGLMHMTNSHQVSKVSDSS